MSRIAIDMPQMFTFSTEISVRITDVNYGNHLGHDSIMAILHEARVQMLASDGFSEIDIGGCGLIMADTAIVFKQEVFYPATLRCDVCVSDMSKSGFAVYYRISRVGDNAHIADAKTSMVCFDYQRKRPARMPEPFRARYGRHNRFT